MEVPQLITDQTCTDFICILAAGLLLVYLLLKEKSSHLPSGPFAIPILGNLLQIGKQPHVSLHKMRKTYGDVFRVYFGSQLVIIVCGRKFVDEVLNGRSASFAMRPDFFSTKYFLKGKSFAFGRMNLSTHKLYKSIAMTALKKTEIAFSKSTSNGYNGCGNLTLEENISNNSKNSNGLEKLISKESVNFGRKMVELGKKCESTFGCQGGQSKQYRDAVYKVALKAAASIMCSISFGKRYRPEDQQLDFITDILLELHEIDKKITLLSWIPILRKIWKRPINTFIGLNKTFEGLIEMHIAARKRFRSRQKERSISEDRKKDMDFSFSNSITDNLLDIKDEEEQWESANDSMTTTLMGDIFGAGVDTMAVVMMWLVVYFTTFPDITLRVKEEIDQFVNKNHRQPLYSDTNCFPLLCAFISETLRHSSVVPFTVPHSTGQSEFLGGYSIPQGSSILISMWSINHDSELWGDHEIFRPKRFIKDDGTFDKSMADKVLIYGAGRRRCAGMALSKIHMFIFSATLLHTFTFATFGKKNVDLPQAQLGLSLIPLSINSKMTERED